jgi:hypothetical protein
MRKSWARVLYCLRPRAPCHHSKVALDHIAGFNAVLQEVSVPEVVESHIA